MGYTLPQIIVPERAINLINPQNSIFICLALCLLCNPLAYAKKNPKEEIKQLTEKISAITTEIKQSESIYTKENATLFHFDQQIALILEIIAGLDKKNKELEKDILQIQQIQSSLETEIEESQSKYAELASLFFMTSDTSYMKALFNNQTPGEMGRGPVYFSYIQNAFKKSQRDLSTRIATHKKNQQELNKKQKSLEELLDENRTKITDLKSKQKDRTQFLKKLNAQILDSKAKKQKMLEDQARLEKLAKEIEALARKAKKSASGMGFAKRKSGLAWPVEGKIVGNYGKRRVSGGVKWRGLLIEAKAGTSVKTVAAGQVIFADWLSNYGYVVIIDHGKNYLSLYGHNRRVVVNVGENVGLQQTIAEVGNSGRSGSPALYFEIRYKGKPVNPRKWLVAKKSKR